MHRYRIIAQISLILSILNLVLAAPIVVQKIHEARDPDDDSENTGTAAISSAATKSGEAALGELPPPPSEPSPNAIEPPRHSSSSSSDGARSSGYSASDSSSDSGYSWWLDRPARPSLHLPASSYDPASHPSSSGPSEIPTPRPLHHVLEIPSPNPSSSESSSGLWEISSQSTPAWLDELERVLAMHMVLNAPSTETDSSSERFTPSHHLSSASSVTIPSTKYASASAGSLSSHYFSASEGPPDSPPPSPPENAKFLSENMVKKLKIVGGLAAIGTIITGIAVPLTKHRADQDG